MYYYWLSKNNLFSTYSLDAYLKNKIEPLRIEVHSLAPQVSQAEDSALLQKLLQIYSVQAPVIYEDRMAVDAKEADIVIPGGTRINLTDMTVKGLSITVVIPFTGEPDLFYCRASIYTISGTPDAEVTNTTLTLHYETTEKDPEKIKSLWLADIASIKKNLEWINKDATLYNSMLENTIKTNLANRKKEVNDYQSIISQLH